MTLAIVEPSPYLSDPRVDVVAKALAWSELTEYGRLKCDWEKDFSERERAQYRATAIEILWALDAVARKL
jgi:hypothetical protein